MARPLPSLLASDDTKFTPFVTAGQPIASHTPHDIAIPTRIENDMFGLFI
jgi:hypothetical protein